MINFTRFFLLNCMLLLSQKVFSAPLNDGETVSEKKVNLDSSTITNITTEEKIDRPTEDDDTKNTKNMMSPSSLRLSKNPYERDVSMNSEENNDLVNMGFNLATGASTFFGNLLSDVREKYNEIENSSTKSRFNLVPGLIRKPLSLGMAAADTTGDRIISFKNFKNHNIVIIKLLTFFENFRIYTMQSIIFKPIYLFACMLLVSRISANNESKLTDNNGVYGERLPRENITPEGTFILFNWLMNIPLLNLNHRMEIGTNGNDEPHIGELIKHGKEDPQLIEKICNGNPELYVWWKESPIFNLSLNKVTIADNDEETKAFRELN
ncbi:Hypothetical protein CINCED_3A018513 [Cinara cedri]|uniref:Uncharacterized protein n=1 Tax=Cinara cedri TaxID=506608 RepID=A0A5E4MGX3_9HEMI|nr:Hypothetical protein CINCED_3A018513 [Cinara cedri]